jgi:hypothetical protein
VVSGHVTPDADLAPGDGERLRAAPATLHLFLHFVV